MKPCGVERWRRAIENLSTGSRTVSFKDISGRTIPVAQTVTVLNGQTGTAGGILAQHSGCLWGSSGNLGGGWYYLSWFWYSYTLPLARDFEGKHLDLGRGDECLLVDECNGLSLCLEGV